MESIKGLVNEIILNPDLAPLLAIVKSARNGAVYGAKVRFPHALVMVFLFRSGTLREKLFLILKATRQHARNLAYFAVVYKSSMLLLRTLNPIRPGKEGPYDTFLAGLLGGYTVFGKGRQGSVNQQIVIYIFARVALALAKISIQPRRRRSRSSPFSPLSSPSSSSPSSSSSDHLQSKYPILSLPSRDKIQANAWPVFASLSWALVMYIFRWYPDTVQPSLRSSMKYIYVDSDHWDSFRSFMIRNV